MKTSYCPGWNNTNSKHCKNTYSNSVLMDLSIWRYHTADELGSLMTFGEFNTYSGGGYVVTLPMTRQKANAVIQDLPYSNWIDRHTRAVFLEFTLYSPNVNLFAYCKILAEFPETGSIFRWTNYHVFRPYVFIGSTGTLAIVCYAVFCITLLASTIKILQQLCTSRCKFFLVAWNVTDLLCILLSYGLISVFVLRTLKSKEAMDDFLPRLIRNEFTNFQQVINLDYTVECLLGVLVFIVTLRILKILGYNKRLTEITAVITNAARDLAGFGVVFAVIFFAYVLYGYLLFGKSVDGYKNVFSSFGTLTNTLIGKNKLDVMIHSIPGIAQLYYFSYNFVVLWTVMTMFAAILNKSIEEVRAEMKKTPRIYGVFDMITTSIQSLFRGVFKMSHSKKRMAKSGTLN